MRRRELWVMLFLVCAAVAISAIAFGPAVFEGTVVKGAPNDVTRLVSRETLLRSSRLAKGPAGARFTMVEFGDFQCKSCAKAAPILEEIEAKHPDMRVVFRHCPITVSHKYARLASKASEAAALQHRFWEMYNALYTLQDEWTAADDVTVALVAAARVGGVNGDRLVADMNRSENRFDSIVDADVADSVACSVKQTPSFFLITPTRTWAAVGPGGLTLLRDGKQYWE